MYYGFILIILTLSSQLFIGCSTSIAGITLLDDFNTSDNSNEVVVSDKQFHKAMKAERMKLKLRNRNKAIKESLLKEAQVKKLDNLTALGVINITQRLKGPLVKHEPLTLSTVEKKSHFVKRVDGSKDRFGGKLICNKDVLTFRIDRTNFIECQENYLKNISIFKYTIRDHLINWKLTTIINVLKKDIKKGCELIYAASLQSYHEMAQCLIDDLTEHGFFKFRNVNSLGSKFSIIKQ